MKRTNRILSRRGFLASSLLGGLLASILPSGKVEASASPLGFPYIKISTLPIPKNVSQAQPVGAWVKIGDIGTLEIMSWNSIVELSYQGRVKATGGGKTTFALSLSGNEVTYGSPMFEVNPEQLMQNVFAYFTAYHQVVGYYSPGIWTVSLWGYTESAPGGAVFMNPTSSDNQLVIMKEYMPMSSTYLPTIVK